VIFKIVPDELIAWGAGFGHLGRWYEGSPWGGINEVALQIELENDDKQGSMYPVTQIRSCVLQVAEWLRAYGPMPILGHFHLDEAKKDPAWFPWSGFSYQLWREMSQ
jgi:N-acetyl-anhydromuramyl-L-alanine amidase AmpD